MARRVSVVPKLDSSRDYSSFKWETLAPSLIVYFSLQIPAAIFHISLTVPFLIGLCLALATVLLHFFSDVPVMAAFMYFSQPKYYTANDREPYETMTYYQGVSGPEVKESSLENPDVS